MDLLFGFVLCSYFENGIKKALNEDGKKLETQEMKTKPFTFLLALTNPKVLYDRNEVLSKLCPIPSESGVYAWYFRDIPNNVPLDK